MVMVETDSLVIERVPVDVSKELTRGVQIGKCQIRGAFSVLPEYFCP